MEKAIEAGEHISPEDRAGEPAADASNPVANEEDQGIPQSKSQESPEMRLSVSGESLYAILQLEKGATPEQVKKAYRKLALKFHPDKNRDDPKPAEEKFKEINHANKILSDEKKKSIYDEYGSLGLYIADQIGEDYVKLYFALNSRCFKVTSIICCLLTGCCFCCCLCCCCCGCCGLCKKCRGNAYDEEDEDVNLSDIERGSTDDRGSESGEPVTSQPGSTGGMDNPNFDT